MCVVILKYASTDGNFSQAFSGETEFMVIIPGGDIPTWFDYQTTNHSMSFEVHSRVSEKVLGLGTSVLLYLEDGASTIINCDLSINGELVYSLASALDESQAFDHLWLGYFPLPQNLHEMRDGWNLLEISLQFLDDDSAESDRVKLKGLGARFVGKTDDRAVDESSSIRSLCPENSGVFQEEHTNTSADMEDDILFTGKCHGEELQHLEGDQGSGTNAVISGTVNRLPEEQKKPHHQRPRRHQKRARMGLGLKLTSFKICTRKTRKRKMR